MHLQVQPLSAPGALAQTDCIMPLHKDLYTSHYPEKKNLKLWSPTFMARHGITHCIGLYIKFPEHLLCADHCSRYQQGPKLVLF